MTFLFSFFLPDFFFSFTKCVILMVGTLQSVLVWIFSFLSSGRSFLYFFLRLDLTMSPLFLLDFFLLTVTLRSILPEEIG